MKNVDVTKLDNIIFLKCGSISDINICMYKDKKYVYKEFLDPAKVIDDAFIDRFKLLSSKKLKQAVLPTHMVVSSGEKVGYLTPRLEKKNILTISDPLERYYALVDTKKAIENLHNNDIIHGDIHAGNILIKNNKHCLIDFDNCEIPSSKSVKLDLDKCCISAMNYINTNGVVKNLDIYMFNVLTFFAFNVNFNNCIFLEEIFDNVRSSIYHGKCGIFSNDNSKRACEDIYLYNSKDYLIDTITEEDVKVYKKQLLYKNM